MSSHLHCAHLVYVKTKSQIFYKSDNYITEGKKKKPKLQVSNVWSHPTPHSPLLPAHLVSCFLSAPPYQNSKNIHLYCPERTNQAAHSRRQPSASSKDNSKLFCCLNRPLHSDLNKNIQKNPTKLEGEILPELAANNPRMGTPAQKGKSSHSCRETSGE